MPMPALDSMMLLTSYEADQRSGVIGHEAA
jgi:hypothetical protein